MELNIIALYPNLARAVEIALVAKVNISIYADKEYKTAKEDMMAITQYYGQDILRQGNNPYMYVQIHKPINIFARGETLKDIQDRIKALLLTEVKSDLNDSCRALLKSAWDRINLSLPDINNILHISRAIAFLDKSKEIKVEHVAEATMYVRNCIFHEEDADKYQYLY
jgi:hypothetical protein